MVRPSPVPSIEFFDHPASEHGFLDYAFDVLGSNPTTPYA
jgi:hypothetical protein